MRTVFFVSDGTAITAETLGQSLLAQFKNTNIREVVVPYVDTLQKAEELIGQIHDAGAEESLRPIVFSTLAQAQIRERILGCNALVLDLFRVFLHPLQEELQAKPLQRTGLFHHIEDMDKYESRINAVNFTLLHDDGAFTKQYDQADLILIGVSRCGKTPTCLYLALKFGLRVANYPFTDEDLAKEALPKTLQPYVNKLYGLTTLPERLQKIRAQRRPGSRYASLAQCRYELRAVEHLFIAIHIPFLNTSTRSVEEIATKIARDRTLQRRYV